MKRPLGLLGFLFGMSLSASSTSSGAIIKLDAPEYRVPPGHDLTVQVIIGITEGQVNAANVGFRLEATPAAGASGTLTTSLAGVSQSLLSPYIFVPNAGFFNTGSGGAIATGGDNASDGLNDLLRQGDYYLAAVTWSPSADAAGDFLLRFAGLGTITVLTDPNDTNFLTQGVGDTVHVVPEPSCLALLGLAGCWCLFRRRIG